jgi:hypothetical protein
MFESEPLELRLGEQWYEVGEDHDAGLDPCLFKEGLSGPRNGFLLAAKTCTTQKVKSKRAWWLLTFEKPSCYRIMVEMGRHGRQIHSQQA